MTPTPSHPQRAARPPRAKQANLNAGITVWPADGGRVSVIAFWPDMLVMPGKCDTPVWYTWARIQQYEVEWRRDG